jgi:hypothetical protein
MWNPLQIKRGSAGKVVGVFSMRLGFRRRRKNPKVVRKTSLRG